jgi:hypothetical protein
MCSLADRLCSCNFETGVNMSCVDKHCVLKEQFQNLPSPSGIQFCANSQLYMHITKLLLTSSSH